jgi:hypothetical protein
MAYEINITMLGPSRVGKTSLLASLYYTTPDVVRGTNLSLAPDIETEDVLMDCVGKLKNLANYKEFSTNEGIEGDQAERSFYFKLGLVGRPPALQLHFQDYPGGWIKRVQDSAHDSIELNQVKQFIRDSVAILIPIDTPALFAIDTEECDRINQISTVSNLIEDVFNASLQSNSLPRLLILVPLKCERYMRSKEDSSQIQGLVRERYKRLLTYVNQPDLLTRIAVVLTPVQTTGNIVFSYPDPKDRSYQYRPINDEIPFSPQDADQPLRYLMRFLLKLHLENRRWMLLEGLRQLFTGDDKLKVSIDEFARGCKNNSEFVILQGLHWLSKGR